MSDSTASIDPVCGMTVGADAPFSSVHNGETIHFCSGHCKAKFDAAPESFLKNQAPPKKKA